MLPAGSRISDHNRRFLLPQIIGTVPLLRNRPDSYYLISSQTAVKVQSLPGMVNQAPGT